MKEVSFTGAGHENGSCIVATRGVRVRWPLAFAGPATNKHNLKIEKKLFDSVWLYCLVMPTL